MYHLFTSADRTAIRDELDRFVAATMSPEASLATIDGSEYVAGRVRDALGASSLFGGEQWFIIDTPSADGDFKEEVSTVLKELAESPNTFLILEGALLAPERKKYEKHAESVVVKEAAKNARFDMFSLTEAFAKRDKRKLWLLLQEARLEGARDEEIIGILWWQLKSLRLAALSGSPEEAGMKPYPYNKAKQALAAFPVEQVIQCSHSLLESYHDARAGKRELGTALETWVLTI